MITQTVFINFILKAHNLISQNANHTFTVRYTYMSIYCTR